MITTGVGFPRTGTYSLKNALQKLGYKCYHFEDIFTTPSHAEIWTDYITNKADSGKPPPFQDLLAGYDAVVDFPCALFHRELRKLCPDAAVLLTQRDTNLWVRSMTDLLATGDKLRKYRWLLKYFHSQQLDQFIIISDFIHKKAFGKMTRKELVSSYNTHNASLAADPHVTVMEPKEGWTKLCAMLGLEVPRSPYPHLNTKAGVLRRHVVKILVKSVLLWFVLPMFGVFAAFYTICV